MVPGVGLKPRLPRRFPALLELRRSRTLALAALTGVLTGAGVAAFEWVTREQVFDRLVTAPSWVQAVALVVGLTLSALVLRFLGRGASPTTADEYVENFHESDRDLDLRPAPAKLVAGAATLGSGGSLGYEGPSLYLGATIGTWLTRRWPRQFARSDSKVLMVAGAAAGVAAIFKAPATGAVFALEVPYRDDTARRMLLPALLAAACGYLMFVALVGTEPLFAVTGSPGFDLLELAAAGVLGVVCGLGARGFAHLITFAKDLSGRGHVVLRVGIAGLVLAGMLVASEKVFGQGLSSGSGYRVLEWVTDPGHGLLLIVALLGFRLVATATTLAGGGSGGLFIPLVVAGALVGAGAATVVGDTTTLFPLIGVAAFLGAGYRTPLAGVMFVAETTGSPGFIVPGLIASVAAQLVMGDRSVSLHQTTSRVGHLERRFGLPISAVIRGDVLTIPPEATLREFYEDHLLLTRERSVAVMDGQDYRGMISSSDLRNWPPEEWGRVRVVEATHTDWPVARPGWTLQHAIGTMETLDVDTLPVVDGEGSFVGVVTTADILRLDEILSETDRPTSA